MPTIFFIRHGETDWNAEGRLQGQRDIDLNQRGEAQASQAGRILRRLAPHAGELGFLASPLTRTRRTMALAREAAGLAPFDFKEDPRLMEISFGAWEGLTWPELTARDPEGAAGREADKWGYQPPGGESYGMLVARIRPVFESLTRDSVIVSHGGVARAMLSLLCGVAPERAPHLDIWQGRVIVVENGAYRWV